MSDETPISVSLTGYRVIYRFEDAGGCAVPTRQENVDRVAINDVANVWDFGGGDWEVWIVAKPKNRQPTVEEAPSA